MRAADRHARRIRERGRPAPALVLATHRGDAGDGHTTPWGLELRVEPGDRPAFDASVAARYPRAAEPAVGARVEVLLDPRGGRRIGFAGDGPPLLAPAPTPEPVPPAPDSEPLDPTRLIAQVVRAFADGSLAADRPAVLVDPAGPQDPGPNGAHGELAEAGIADLVALAADEPRPVADEVLRRVGAGQQGLIDILEQARAEGPAGAAAVRAVADDLRRRGLIGAARHSLLTRLAD